LQSQSTASLARRVLPTLVLIAATATLTAPLAGCGTARPSTAAVAPKTVPCPEIAQYSPELRNRAAEELDLLPVGSAIEVLLNDYETLRDGLRACRSDRDG
jgi:predicted RNA methylase